MRPLAFRPLALSLLLLAVATGAARSQQQPGSFALRAKTVITISGEDLSPGVVLVREGLITAVGGPELALPEGLEVIEAGDGVLMPGFIDAHSNRGLDLIFESAADSSFVRVTDGLNPVSLEIEDARRNGITTLLVAPSNSSLVGGRSAIIHPQGIAVESMIVEQDAALKISLKPRSGTSRMGHLAQLRRILDGTKRYLADRETERQRKGPKAQEDIPPEREALVDLLEGRSRAFIYCSEAADVSTAFALGRSYGFHVTPILAPETWRAASLVQANKVRVILTPRLDAWELQPDGSQLHVNLAKILSEAGVEYSLTTDSRELGAQHPWYQAARAVRAGVPRAEALAAVTQHPAALLGFGRRKGVIAQGADADLLLLSADPLSGSAFVDRAWVRGIEIYDRASDEKLQRLLQVGSEPPMVAPESDHGDPKVEGMERRLSEFALRSDPAAREAAQRWPLGPSVSDEPEAHPAPVPAWVSALEQEE